MERNDSVTRWTDNWCGKNWYPKNIIARRERLYKNLDGLYRLKTRHILDQDVLYLLQLIDQNFNMWGTIMEGFENSIHLAFPPGMEKHMILTKMKTLIERDLIEGCLCGCRGDFSLTPKARHVLPSN